MALNPTFDKDVTEYSAETANASNKVTATPEDDTATVKITVGETEIASGSSATWEEGENTVTVVVTNGGNTKTYTVTVDYTPETGPEDAE